MNTRLVISLKEVEQMLEPRGRSLRKHGIDPRDLLRYSFIAAQKQDYDYINHNLSKDVLEVYPQIVEDLPNYRRVIHSCLDYVIEGAQAIVPMLRRVTGQVSPHVEFDRFHGEAAVVTYMHDI